MVDPQIWRNEKIGALPDAGRLLFIGIFSQADDDGRLKGSPRFLMASIFPYDTHKTEKQVKDWRDQCAAQGLIRLYSKNGQEYLDLPHWYEHQQIRKDRYASSNLPSITDADEVSPLNQPVKFEPEPPAGPSKQHYERTAQHTIAQLLKDNSWQPTNEPILSVETNMRLGNRYADIVAITATRHILIEIKSYPLHPNDLGQVIGYRRELQKRVNHPIHTLLIGASPGSLSPEEVQAANVQILNLKDVYKTCQPVNLTVETTDQPNIIKSSLVKSNTPLLRKGARTKQVDPVINEIFTEMRTYLGFPDKLKKDPIPSYGKEGQTIKRMLTRGFTREEILACWRSKVSQRGGEFVSMTWVNEDIGKKRGKAGQQLPTTEELEKEWKGK